MDDDLTAHPEELVKGVGAFDLVGASCGRRGEMDLVRHAGVNLDLAFGHHSPILGRDAKKAALVEARARLGLGPSATMAVGDGANDSAMIGEAGLGVAYRAKPAVAAAARMRIDHGDLTALLYAQGYSVDEFVGDTP